MFEEKTAQAYGEEVEEITKILKKRFNNLSTAEMVKLTNEIILAVHKVINKYLVEGGK